MTPRTRNRIKLIALGVAAVLPVVASYLVYWFWVPEQHTNYGTLIEPRRVPALRLQTLEAAVFEFAALRGRWIMLVVDGGRCGPRCQEKLWQMRQVRQAQGKELARIERVWLIDDEHSPDAEIERDYRGTWIIRASAETLAGLLPAERSPREHIYLIDPLGNLMLRFPPNAEPKRMIKDLSRLLKYSRSG